MARAVTAQASVAHASQEEVDALCKAMVDAASKAAADLARLAVSETGIGRAPSKVLKNLFASEGVWESIRNERTVGVMASDPETGVTEVATPIGVVAGIVPTTNPTSTAIGKSLIALKGRNAIVISPHPRAKRCIAETCEVLRRALERAGANPDLIQVLEKPTLESTGALMKHKDLKLILATGGAGLVQAAYSSGKPAYGVGPGNVPVYIDRSADLREAGRWIVESQQFDFATLCCSEQALVLDERIAERMLSELAANGAHVCSPDETAQLEKYAVRGGHMNPDVVGVDPRAVARAAGFQVPSDTKVLLAHQAGVGPKFPLSCEILCPLLSVHVVDGWEEGCRVSFEILRNGGLGHTIGVWATDHGVLDAWALQKPASRIVVNGPTSQGSVGYSTGLAPSMSLGCGPLAGNITSDNITAKHLINVKRVATRTPGFEERFAKDQSRALELLGERELAPTARRATPPVDPSTWRPDRKLTPAVMPKATPAASPAPAPTYAPAIPSGSGVTRPGVGQPVPAWARGQQAASPGSPPARSDSSGLPAPLVAATGPKPGSELGSGCPMGPCRGCPLQDVRTGACTA